MHNGHLLREIVLTIDFEILIFNLVIILVLEELGHNFRIPRIRISQLHKKPICF
jgi:hypothetical protein